MKKFDKKFADRYIAEMIENEREFERDTYSKQMNDYELAMHHLRLRGTHKYEHTPLVAFFLKCNWFEKIMLIIAQSAACCLPFIMFIGLESKKFATISVLLWITGAAALVLLSVSKKIKGEKVKISFKPKFNITHERRYY